MNSLQPYSFTQIDYGPDKQIVNCSVYQHGKSLGAITIGSAETGSENIKQTGVSGNGVREH